MRGDGCTWLRGEANEERLQSPGFNLTEKPWTGRVSVVVTITSVFVYLRLTLAVCVCVCVFISVGRP